MGLIAKGAYLQGNTNILIGWEQFVSPVWVFVLFEKHCKDKFAWERSESKKWKNQPCSQLPCVLVLYGLFLLNTPDLVKTNFPSRALPTCTFSAPHSLVVVCTQTTSLTWIDLDCISSPILIVMSFCYFSYYEEFFVHGSQIRGLMPRPCLPAYVLHCKISKGCLEWMSNMKAYIFLFVTLQKF